jgi:apolipoprotein N-acyltransferase
MTLTSEELRTSWVWNHKWQTLAICMLVWILSGFTGYLVPSLIFFPLAFVNVVPLFLLLRLAQLYNAPKRLKDEATTNSG